MTKIRAAISNGFANALFIVTALAVVIAVADVFGWRAPDLGEITNIQSPVSIVEGNLLSDNKA